MTLKTKEPQPSRLSQWLIRKIFRDDVEANLGDFLEIYTDFMEKGGRFRARFRFCAYLMMSIPKYFRNTLGEGGHMLKNYLKIAFRNMQRNKASTLINIFGLARDWQARSLSCCGSSTSSATTDSMKSGIIYLPGESRISC